MIGYLIFLVLFIPFATFAIAALSAAPWVPSRKRTRDLLLDRIQLASGDCFVELGCGDGRILFDFAKRYPTATFIGYEIAFPVYLIAKIRSLFYTNVRIRYRSIFRFEENAATHIFTFLTIPAYTKLAPILLASIRPGTHLYSEAWPLLAASPTTVFTIPKTEKIYHYIV